MDPEDFAPKVRSAKRGVDIASGARKRAGQGVSLRDKARTQQLRNSRAAGTLAGSVFVQTLPPESEQKNVMAYDPNIDPDVLHDDLIEICVFNIQNQGTSVDVKERSISLLRKQLCKKKSEYAFVEILSCEIGMKIMHIYNNHKHEMPFSMVKEILSFFSTQCGGPEKSTYAVINVGGLHLFGGFLKHEDPEMRSLAVTGMASICINANCRDMTEPWFPTLCEQIVAETDRHALKQLCYFFTQFSKVKKYLHTSVYMAVLPRLKELLCSPPDADEAIARESMWALSYIGDGDTRMPAIASPDVINRCAHYLASDKAETKVPALRMLGNFVSGDDKIADYVLNTNCMTEIPRLLQNTNVKVRKETLWCLSNIAAGTQDQVSWLLQSGYLPLCTEGLKAEFTVKKEALWVFKNISDIATKEQFLYLIQDCQFLGPFLHIMDCNDYRVVLPILDSVTFMIDLGANVMKEDNLQSNPIIDLLNQQGLTHTLQSLCTHPNVKVTQEAGYALAAMSDDWEHGGHDEEDEEWYEDGGMGGGGGGGGLFPGENPLDGWQDGAQ